MHHKLIAMDRNRIARHRKLIAPYRDLIVGRRIANAPQSRLNAMRRNWPASLKTRILMGK